MAEDDRLSGTRGPIRDARTAPQISDAVAQSSLQTLGAAPGIALATLYQALAQSTTILFANSVAAQQQQNMLAQAAAAQGVIQLYSFVTLADADAAVGLSESSPQNSPIRPRPPSKRRVIINVV
jgi:hypothetical protein